MEIHPLLNRFFQWKGMRSFNSITPAIGMGLVAAFFVLLLAPLPCLALQYDEGTALSPADSIWAGYRTVAISGDFSLVGNSDAIIFEDKGESGFVEHKLIPTDYPNPDGFGSAVAISGNVAVVGAPYDEESPNSQNSGSVYVFRYNGSNWVQEDKLIGDDVVAGDTFGYSVAVSGNTILVGSIKSYGSVNPGSVYAFRYDGANWNQEDQFVSSDSALDDDFGKYIALSGDTAVVGMPNNDATSDLGVVYLFRYNGTGSWLQEDRLTVPTDSALAPFGASFGETFAVSGDTLLVGAYRGYDDSGDRVGAVYVYGYDGAGSWVEEAKLTGDGLYYVAQFGRSIALSGDTVVIGTRCGSLAGCAAAAYVFWYDGVSWVKQDTLVGPGSSAQDIQFGRSIAISGTTVLATVSSTSEVFLFRNIPDAEFIADDGAQYDYFGDAVALSGDTVLVGAPGDEDNGFGSGSAYLFRYDGANWIDEDKLIGAVDDYFGTSVALAGDIAIIGSPGNGSIDLGADFLYGPGAAYVFRYGGATWSQEKKLTPAGRTAGAGEDLFGYSVAISGNTVVVGAPGSGWVDGTAWVNGPGAAYVFWYNGASWVSQGKLLPTGGGAEEDRFGSSVSISGDTIVVGAPFEDEYGIDAGAAYVFQRSSTTWIPQGKLPSTGIEADDAFGCAVAVSSDTIAVGAKRDGDMADDAGAVYVFGYDGVHWVEESKLTASDGMLNARFGISVAISSANTIAVGAEYDGAKGSAYVFWHDGSSWVEEPKLTAPVRGTDYFGASVAISGDMTLVGAPYANGIVDDSGAAYVSTVEYVNVPEPSMLVLNLATLAALAFVARRRASP